jgi:hypothetical protein
MEIQEPPNPFSKQQIGKNNLFAQKPSHQIGKGTLFEIPMQTLSQSQSQS